MATDCIYRGPKIRNEPCLPCRKESKGVVDAVPLYSCRKKGNCVFSGNVGVVQCRFCDVPKIGLSDGILEYGRVLDLNGVALALSVNTKGGNW